MCTCMHVCANVLGGNALGLAERPYLNGYSGNPTKDDP